MAGKNVHEFTADGWEREVLQSEQPVLVDFWAPWCGPCKALSPIIDRLADQFEGRVKIGKVNVEDHPSVATEYAVSALPRILIFKGGRKPVRQIAGVPSERELAKALTSVLEDNS